LICQIQDNSDRELAPANHPGLKASPGHIENKVAAARKRDGFDWKSFNWPSAFRLTNWAIPWLGYPGHDQHLLAEQFLHPWD
jgi:hypothetical protein